MGIAHRTDKLAWKAVAQRLTTKVQGYYPATGLPVESDKFHVEYCIDEDETGDDDHMQAAARLAYSLATCIVAEGEALRHSFPRPNDPSAAWQMFGPDDRLFSDVDLEMAYDSRIPHWKDFRSREKWETACRDGTLAQEVTYAAPAISLFVNGFSDMANPHRLIPQFIYLAQRPGVPLDVIGMHYCTVRHYEERGVTSYLDLTFQHYLSLNLLLAMNPRPSIRNAAWDAPPRLWKLSPALAAPGLDTFIGNPEFEEHVHHAFWEGLWSEQNGERTVTASDSEISAYLEWCFDILVGWYAVASESSHTACALGKYHPALVGPRELSSILLFQLEAIGAVQSSAFVQNIGGRFSTIDAWLYIEPSHGRNANVPFVANCEVSALHPSPSLFLSLPSELLALIISHLPLQSAYPLLFVCKRIHNLCLDVLFEDPVALISHSEPSDSADLVVWLITSRQRRLTDLRELLLSRPDLCSRLRSFGLLACHDMAYYGWDSSGGDATFTSIPLQNPMVRFMSNLTTLSLYIPHPVCDTCDERLQRTLPDAHVPHCQDVCSYIFPAITRRWPYLYSLIIMHTNKGNSIHPLHDLTIASPTRTDAEAHHDESSKTWNLRSLSFATAVGKPTTMDHIPTRMLLDSVALSLETLSLDILPSSRVLGTIPVLLGVRNLRFGPSVFETDIHGLLARCFPNVTSLQIGNFVRKSAQIHKPLDLAICTPKLEELALEWPLYDTLPTSLQSLLLEIGDINSLVVVPPCHWVKAVAVRFLPADLTLAQSMLAKVAQGFPDVESLEIVYFRGDTVAFLNKINLSTIIAHSFPCVKELVLECFATDQRQDLRHPDYPIDDRHAILQNEWAHKFFYECPMLDVISFNSIPADWEPPNIAPARVWARVETYNGVVGARPVGREHLKWKLSERWPDSTA